MDYEKKYKETLANARQEYNTTENVERKQWLVELFPELTESEDEKVRKTLIELVKCNERSGYTLLNNVSTSSMLAWLEKQGEVDADLIAKQFLINKGYPIDANGTFPTYEELYNIIREGLENQGEQDMIPLDKAIKFLDEQLVDDKDEVTGEPFINFQNYGAFKKTFISFFKRKMLEKQGELKSVDKVEPKFHEGDWVVLTAGELSTTLQIVNVDTNKRLYWFNDNSYLPIVDEECLRHWTIQDAKDGDVLACDEEILLFKYYSVGRISLYCWYNGHTKNFHSQGEVDTVTSIRNRICQATKEQHDLLFQKMKEAGYEWDAKEKELKKIHIIDEGKAEMDYC